MNIQAKKKFFSGLFGRWPYSLLCLFVLPMSAWAQVTFEQKSDPAGLFTSTSATKNLNEVVSTMTPSLSTGGYSFTHWTVNGVRENAPDGQAKNKVSVTLTENTVAIAHYRLDTNDSDSDGVPDWYEVRMFGNLDRNASYDGDGDGLSLADERKYGLAATIADEFMEGGASIRRSGQVFANFGGAKKLSVSSDPAGLLTSSETFPETNSSYTSPNKNGVTSGYYFSHWEVNGVRQADTSGIGLSQISFTMTEDKTVVAKYYAENADTDSDGLPDWYEWREFGNLDNNGTSDPDGDGFSMDAERQFGLSAVIGDEIMEGGASIRRSGQVFANFGGAKKLSVSSDPAGLLTSSETFPETNSSYTSPNKNGLTSGYYFSHWEVNGVRQADKSGIGLSQISFTMTEDKTVVAKYYAENADTDSDGLPDWYEWREFGNLDNNGTSDPDGDGFSMDAERQFGLSAVIGDEIMEGGGSIRRSSTFGYIEFQPNEDDDGDGLTKAQELHYGTSDDNADSDGDGFSDGAEVSAGSDPADADSVPNRPPRDLNSTAVLAFQENQPVDTIIGEFNATDPDGDAITYHLANGENNNSPFTLDSNGTLKTASTFDYESNASTYTITVQAKDELNATTHGNFTVTLLDDDTEDRDGDGFTDGQEAEAGTNPDSNTSIPGLDYSLVAWYPFDGNASDMSGNEHHGTINGATLGFDRHGEANKCYSFDGINDSIRATYTGSQYLFEEVSFGAWVKVKRIVADEAIIDLNGFYLNVLGSGRGNEGGTLEFGSGNWLYPQWASNFSNSASVDDQIWNQIFGIYNGESLLVYKNGQLIKNRSSTTTNPTISFDLSIGKNKNGSRPTEGLIDEVRIYNRALLPREIFELYNLEKPNMAPSNLGSATPLTIGENQSIGTLVSNFNATDPDGYSITYHFLNGENNNSLFTLDTNGTLKTATTFDYEINASSYTITVQAKDELNATTEGNFTVTLLDVYEDLDGDGTADHLDDDMDGDGFTNAEELAIGSDPRSSATLPLNDSNFMSAISLWFNAERNATALYGHISDWNTSAVTTMVRAFENRTSFNQDISNWDVSQVTQTNSMFRGATAFNQPIGDWNVTKVTLTSNMFHDASSFNQPIGKWDVSLVTNMTNMFKGAFVFNQPIGDWNVSSVTSMGSMFYDAKAFNQPIGNWDVSKVTIMNSMFRGASSFNQAIGDWNVSASTNMAAMFYNASAFDQAIGNWDVSRVLSMMNIFRGATVFNQPIGDWNVSAVTSMASVFYDAKAFNQSLGKWDVSGATVMNSMFRGASSFNQSIEDWDISQVTNTNGMFGGADNLENITKRKIHKTFSSNQNWEYDWRPHLANSSPIDLNKTLPLTLAENQPTGTFIGEFNATDLEGDAITFNLPAGENYNSLFSIETNGTLRSAATLDYETENSYIITIQAKDEYNATTEGNFTVTLLDIFEDLDRDGTADHLDDDMDGDGFTNAKETAYGSDPRDENSVADTLPTALTLDNLQILENQPIGTVVGKFTVIDPDPDDVHRVMFSQLDQNDSHNHLFIIDANNSLRTAVVFDFENNSSDLILRVKVRHGQVDVLRESFTLSLINDPADDVVPPTDNNQSTPPSDEHNNSSDNNNTQPPFVDHNGSTDDNDTLPPLTDPDPDHEVNPYAWIPIIHTEHPQILEDGRIQLSGRVLYDGGGTMSEFGFLLSPTLRIPLNSSDTLKLEANGTADSFTLIIPESPYPRRLYVQAYSTNEAGMGLGQRRRLKIPEPLAKWWGEAMQGEGGWLQSPWFGAFKYYEQGWLYHAELGWLYSSPAEDGVWLWGSDNQWLWTKDGIYPYHYRWDNAAWGIWQKTANGRIRTYNYGTGRYE